MVTPGDQLYRTSDHFTADQRAFHPFRSHADAIGDGDGVELHRGSAGGANSFLHFSRQPAQVEIARPDLNPGVSHADNRARKVLIRKANGFEHRTRWRAVRSIGDNMTARL